MNKYKLIIFDLDGTLLDTLQDLTDSVNYSLSSLGYPLRSIDEVRCFVGNGIRKLIERAVPHGCSVTDVDNVFNVFDCHYKLHNSEKTKPYEGICQLIKNLKEKGYLLAVLSNKANYPVLQLCDKFFPNCFDVVFGEREGVRKKPFPDGVIEIVNLLSVSLEQTIYVGDSDVDIVTANNAGIDHCIVTWGFREKDFLQNCGAKLLVDSVNDLETFICG